jgi:hypothetical protein
MPTNPPTITALPTPPDPNDRSSFNVRAYPWSVAQQTFGAELSAVAANTFGNATESAGSASDAAGSAAEAANAVTDAQAARDAAAASAASAVNAPGTSATSTTSLSLSAGTKSLTLVQTGKLFAIGQRIVIARTADPANSRMVGTLSSADTGTGALVATVAFSDVRGSGTFTDWTISLAGESSTLPSPGVPDAGKVLGVDGGGQYALITAPTRGVGAGTASGNTTLTAASGALQAITTTGPGQWVQLPAADTLTVGIAGFVIQNAGGWDLEIRDGAGTPLGWVRPSESVAADPKNVGSVAGAWVLRGHLPYSFLSVPLAFASASNYLKFVVQLDATREVLFFTDNATRIAAVVWDGQAGQFGTPVVVRTAAQSLNMRAIKSATDQVLLLSSPNGPACQAVVLGFSGTVITVNSPVSFSVAGASLISDGIQDLISVAGQGFVVSFNYGAAGTPKGGLKAITISGTTPTIGAGEYGITNVGGGNGNGGNATIDLIDIGSSKVLSFSWGSDQIGYVQLVTVSGTGLTGGTGHQLANPVGNNGHYRLLGSGRVAMVYGASSSYGVILSAPATTVVASAVTLMSNIKPSVLHVVGSNQVIVAGWNSNPGPDAAFNVLTDNAGTAVAGTQIGVTTDSNATHVSLLMGDAAGCVVAAGTAENAGVVYRLEISGNNPVMKSARSLQPQAIYNNSGIPSLWNYMWGKLPPPLLTSGNLNAINFFGSVGPFLWSTPTGGNVPSSVPVEPCAFQTFNVREVCGPGYRWDSRLSLSSANRVVAQKLKVA